VRGQFSLVVEVVEKGSAKNLGEKKASKCWCLSPVFLSGDHFGIPDFYIFWKILGFSTVSLGASKIFRGALLQMDLKTVIINPDTDERE